MCEESKKPVQNHLVHSDEPPQPHSNEKPNYTPSVSSAYIFVTFAITMVGLQQANVLLLLTACIMITVYARVPIPKELLELWRRWIGR